MNPIYNQPQSNIHNPFANVMQTMQQFNQFAQTFQGNPQQQVQNLLNSGVMSNEQYQQLSQMASQLMGMMKGR